MIGHRPRWPAILALAVLAQAVPPVAGARYAFPEIEHRDAVRWLDLSPERRQRLTVGAVDALRPRNEGSTRVRALAALMLSRIRLVEPSRLLALPEGTAPPDARELARLVTEAHGTPAGHTALAAYVTFWLVEPDAFPWIEPDEAHASAIADLVLAAIGEIGPRGGRHAARIRAVARARVSAGSSFSERMKGVELLETVGATAEDAEALVDILTGGVPDYGSLPLLVEMLSELPLGEPLRRRLRAWLDGVSFSEAWSQAPLLVLAEKIGVTHDEALVAAGLLGITDTAIREAAERALASVRLDDEARPAIERWARETLAGLDLRLWFNEATTDRHAVRRAVYAAQRLGIVEGAVAAVLVELLFVSDFGAFEPAMAALGERLDAAQEAAIRKRVTRALTETDRFWPAARVLRWLGPKPSDLTILFETKLRRDESAYGRSAVQGLLSSLEPGGALERAYRQILGEALRSEDPRRRKEAARELVRLGPSPTDVRQIVEDLLHDARPDPSIARALGETDVPLDAATQATIGRALTSTRTIDRSMGLRLAMGHGARPEDLPALAAALEGVAITGIPENAKSALIARAVPPWPFPPTVRVVEDEIIAAAIADQQGGGGAWGYLNGAIIAFVASAEVKGAGIGAGSLLSLALRADGLGEQAFLLLLDQASNPRLRPAIRLVLRLHATPAQRRLVAFLGAPDAPAPWETEGFRSLAAELHILSQEAPVELVSLRDEALRRMVEAVGRHGGWRPADLPELRGYAQSAPAAYRATVERVIERLEAQDARAERVREGAAWVATTLGAHALLWLTLALAYPRSALVQAVFFWNPWVRRVFGLGYAFPLVLAVPALRRRLVEPFARSLAADADLDAFDRERYFHGERVRPLESDFRRGEPVPLAEAIPEIRDHVILEGASGLGKTEALRALTASAPRHVAFLPARRVAEAGAPLEALARKLQGPARDTGFIRSLLHVNALDVVIDGLNEVDAQTRLRIVEFVEDQPRANILIATQPIAWTPPQAGVTRRYELLPLDADQIEQFLLSRRPYLAQEGITDDEYARGCRALVASALDPVVDEQARRRALVTLSNPMDLTLAAELIALGAQPTPGRLVAQQLAQLEAWFTRTHDRPFPVTDVAEHAFAQRLRDDNRVDLAPEVVDALLRFRLAVQAPAADDGQEPGAAVDARFRHDRIAEFFIARHLEARGDEATLRSIAGDPRFQGVVLELAGALPRREIEALFEIVSDEALQSGNHLFALTVARSVAARREAD